MTRVRNPYGHFSGDEPVRSRQQRRQSRLQPTCRSSTTFGERFAGTSLPETQEHKPLTCRSATRTWPSAHPNGRVGSTNGHKYSSLHSSSAMHDNQSKRVARNAAALRSRELSTQSGKPRECIDRFETDPPHSLARSNTSLATSNDQHVNASTAPHWICALTLSDSSLLRQIYTHAYRPRTLHLLPKDSNIMQLTWQQVLTASWVVHQTEGLSMRHQSQLSAALASAASV